MKDKKILLYIKNLSIQQKKKKKVKQPAQMDVEKIVLTFNLQRELSKLKIPIPFNELLRNMEYINKITYMGRS